VINTDISKWSYGQYASSNSGVDTMAFKIGRIEIYFSYDTVVAFREPHRAIVVRQNEWGSTTGKHLNLLDYGDKSRRVSSDVFKERLNIVLKRHNLEMEM